MSRSAWRAAVLLPLLWGALAAQAGAQGGPPAFTELTGTAGCVAAFSTTDESCRLAGGLERARSLTLSPDDRFVYVASGGGLTLGSNGIATFSRDAGTGALEPAGCITATGGDGRPGSEGACARGDALLGAGDVAISADGARAYVAATGSNGLSYFDRDGDTGALTQAGCVKEVKRQDRCDQAPPLVGASEVAVSPDGHDVYLAATTDGAIHAFRRDAETGALGSVQCVSETGSDGLCDPVPGLRDVRDVVMSPAGDAVYAAGLDGVVAAFSRDAETGELTAAGCLLQDAPDKGPCKAGAGLTGAADVAVSPDGRDVYVAGGDDHGTVASFRRGADGALVQTGCVQYVEPPEEPAEDEETDEEDTGDEDAEEAQADEPQEGCTGVTGYVDAFSELVVTGDGRTVFAGGGSNVAMYRRDPASGTLTPAGCAAGSEFTDSNCATLGALDRYGVASLAATADGRNLYFLSGDGALSVLGASVTVASSSVRAARSGRVEVALRCSRARSRACAGRVALTGTRSKQFRVAPGARARVTLRLGPNARRRLARRGALRLMARASDFRHLVRPAARRVTVRRRH
ncbi:MAG TPA: beta-propeller fold lactonase family protein [Solirubrobacteraceae bacterium]|jgi:DNA-binding beta-propeller fold protein YncE